VHVALADAIATISATLPGLRDRALLLVGFAAALRPSEIAELTVDHLAHHANGIEPLSALAQNDQDAEGTTLWLPQGRTELCPAAALTAWLAAAAITEGPFSGASGGCRRRAAPRAHDVSPRLLAFASVPTRSTPIRPR
jgi:hypothetical protein